MEITSVYYFQNAVFVLPQLWYERRFRGPLCNG